MRAPTSFRASRTLAAVAAAFLAVPVLTATSAPSTGPWPAAAAGPGSLAAPATGQHATRPVEDLADREPQTDCTAEEPAGVRRFRDVVLAAYPDSRDGGIVRACGVGGASEHKEGRAWDWMLDAHDPADAAAAEEVLDWLLDADEDGNEHAVARRLGVQYVIWDGRIWSAFRASEGWRPYTGASPHEDHVHLSFTSAGADGATSFFDDVWRPEVGRTYPSTVEDDVIAAPGPSS